MCVNGGLASLIQFSFIQKTLLLILKDLLCKCTAAVKHSGVSCHCRHLGTQAMSETFELLQPPVCKNVPAIYLENCSKIIFLGGFQPRAFFLCSKAQLQGKRHFC